MSRQIIKIDEEKCVGCGLCANACHLSIIGMVDGKAKLLQPDVCDGLGRCLPNCPVGAISFEQVNTPYKDKPATPQNNEQQAPPLACRCPGTNAKSIDRPAMRTTAQAVSPETPSQLAQWPVQIKLIPANAPYFEGANLLVAADCTAYAYGNFHRDLMKNKITIIGCPKLDEGDYSAKLSDIICGNNIKSVTVVRMEVPCCGGIENAVKTALQNSGMMIPWRVVTISTDGVILDD